MVNLFKIVTKNGSEIHASEASMALTHWYFTAIPDFPKELPMEVLTIIKDPRNIPTAYDPYFLMLVIAAVERKYNGSIEISKELFDKQWYVNLPENLHLPNVLKEHKNQVPSKVNDYEKACLEILTWLSKHGDIISFIVPKE